MINKILTPQIQKTAEHTAEFMLFIFSGSLALDYFNVFKLNNFGISFLPQILWGYLLFNISLANILKYFRNKGNPICPKCESKLNEIKEYECPKCGKLKFGD